MDRPVNEPAALPPDCYGVLLNQPSEMLQQGSRGVLGEIRVAFSSVSIRGSLSA
jgi:hypothetical protein